MKKEFAGRQGVPITRESLRQAGMRHLARFPTTRKHLREVLERRLDRAARRGQDIPVDAYRWLDDTVAELERAGLVDDVLFARLRVASLRRSGASLAKIGAKLSQAGVPREIADALLHLEGADEELQAAQRYAERKRLGPYRKEACDSKSRRERDLACLARAGFSFSVALQALSGEGQQPLDVDQGPR